MTTSQPRTLDRLSIRSIVAFAAIALAISTALALPFALGLLPGTAVALMVPLAQLSPMVAALIVRPRGTSIAEALAIGVPSWKALLWACLAAAVAFSAVPLLRLGGGLATGAMEWSPDKNIDMVLVAIPAVLAVQTIFAFGEETGWRGFLHRSLRRFGFWRMSLTIGLLWALWHLPIVLALGLRGGELVSYLVFLVAVSPLLAALRELGLSVWPAVLGHGLLNSVRVAIDQNLAVIPAGSGVAATWIVEAIGWALWIGAAVAVLAAARRRNDGAAQPSPISP